MPAGNSTAPALHVTYNVPKRQFDAGMRHLDHYAARLPRWRYKLRQCLIPIVRAETPYLALIQEKLRTPALDSYFAFTANLGTHTFFMVMLPILFWCGYSKFGRAMTQLLALGVILSGIIKDFLCLPRPLSPPLQRITMSGSAALEYGFPSTHSTNAISVAVYALRILRSSQGDMDQTTNTALQILCYCYGTSIVFGRLYCGMHGFFDVVVGTVLGAAIGFVQILYGDAFDDWICSGGYVHPLIVALILLVIVRTHPEPADDCPCFDDSVAFAGVLVGIETASFTYASSPYSWSDPLPGTTPYSLEEIGWPKTVFRVFLGVLIIFAWRGIMKPLLFFVLPPIFRVFEQVGADLPRKFFLKASEYSTVPKLRKDDNVIPSASEIPNMIAGVRNRRGHAVSVGPQSAADAYETIAYRHEQRRRSISNEPASPTHNKRSPSNSRQPKPEELSYFSPAPRTRSSSKPPVANPMTPIASRSQSYEQITGAGSSGIMTPLTPPDSDLDLPAVSPIGHPLHPTRSVEPFPEYNSAAPSHYGDDDDDVQSRADEDERREIFGKLERLRVRYDAEVITKLVVYAGIGWLAVEGNPVLFELCGLGLGVANKDYSMR